MLLFFDYDYRSLQMRGQRPSLSSLMRVNMACSFLIAFTLSIYLLYRTK